MRIQVEADDASQDLWQLAESLWRRSKIDDSHPQTRHENEQASVKPPVVRTLKDPPEIWELVNETPQHFNLVGAFINRLTSSTTKLILLGLAIILILGLCAFGIITLRDGRHRGAAAPQVQEERIASQALPASQVSEPAPAPVVAPANVQANTVPATEAVITNTQPLSTESKSIDGPATDQSSTTPRSENAASAKPLTDSIQPTGVRVNNISNRTASLAIAPAVSSGNKRVGVAPGRQNADKPRTAHRKSETAPRPDSAKSKGSQPPKTTDLWEPSEKSSNDSSSAKRSNTTPGPQLIAPPTTSSAPKAKVIQWP